MQPNAAMQTAMPQAPRPYFYAGQWRGRDDKFPKRPTSLMIHIEGHGPRRVYRGDHTNRYFYLLKSRRVEVNIHAVLQLLRGD